jgi:bacterioferritin-associated ferredoxin
MYVCICNSVTDQDIRDAVRDGVRDQRELALRTGCSTDCGTCSDFAAQVLGDALREEHAFPPLVQLA